MRVVFASGKGGTGKTTVATNLAWIAGEGTCYADADVEEPNGHLFLNPEITASENVTVKLPRVDLEACTFCGRCRDACRFGAIAVVPKNVLIFDELCHACGGCALACPTDAIYEIDQRTGVVEEGSAPPLRFMQGRFEVGQASSPPVIRALKRRLPTDMDVFIDASPGTSCQAIEAVRGADLCVLVTEPTPFGLNDLTLAAGMLEVLGVPARVVINRDGVGDDGVERWCAEKGIPILARIPNDRRIAEVYSGGGLIVDVLDDVRVLFERMLTDLRVAVEEERR